MGAGHVRNKLGLTEEQEEIRLRGLRILARMIVRHYLVSRGEGAKGGGEGRDTHPPTDGKLPRMEGEDGR